MFKTGDQVKRKVKNQNSYWRERCKEFNVSPDDVFIVERWNAGSIWLENFTYGSWDDVRFELVKIKYKIEDFL